MSVVRINSIEVPPGAGDAFAERFARRAGQVESQPGFEEFLLLRPSDDGTRWFVLTRWESEEAFQAWMSGRDFAAAHSGDRAEAAHHGGAHHGTADAEQSGFDAGHAPVATGSELLAFDVVERVTAAGQ